MTDIQDHTDPTIICKQEGLLKSMAIDLAIIKERVTTNFDAIESHVNSGRAWRLVSVGNMVTLFIAIVSVAFMFGKLSDRTERNTIRLDKVISDLEEHRAGR